MTKQTLFIAIVVSLGGFLFGFDAGIISGVMEFAGPEFDLSDGQWGWVVSSPTFSAMFAMLVSGRLSDIVGRKTILLYVAFLYTFSAILSAYAGSYEVLYIARMIGGLAFGAALILAPTYIAEIASAENRGKLVSVQQLNIVLGFFAAFACNNYFNGVNNQESFLSLTDETVWRWMLGIEAFPAIVYFFLLFFIPKSPRWLMSKNRVAEAQKVLEKLHGSERASEESQAIQNSITEKKEKVDFFELFKPALRFIMIVGLILGVLQMATGINAIYFYATTIFKQTGIGTDAAFTSGVLLSGTSVVFTIFAMVLIDRLGRRPLLLAGIGGIAICLLICAYGFKQATYQLTETKVEKIEGVDASLLEGVFGKTYDNDVDFKRDMKEALGTKVYGKKEGELIEAAVEMNAMLVLIGIIGFIACFAFSLGPGMWVMLSELFPNKYRGLAIGFIGFINSATSWLVTQIFPWELSNLGNSLTFLIFGVIASVGFFIFLKILPETKGKSLEELEQELVRN